MEKACIGFQMNDVAEAYEHMQYEVVRDYGSYAHGHFLHTWDDGKRMLVRCKNCGGYILVQKSEFHAFSSDSDDSYYTDFFPVSSAEEADRLNAEYDGFAIEKEFAGRYLCMTNFRLRWSK